jgi:FkbM family methyltransferase
MSLMSTLKKLSTYPFWANVETVRLGKGDTWSVFAPPLDKNSVIISAGVGKAITFEEDIVARWGARIVLLDPSPTGLKTMQEKAGQPLLDFRPLGLTAEDGPHSFGHPDNAAEGSFRKGADSGLSFECVSLKTLIAEASRSHVDLLKMDVEGFEYEILDALLKSGIRADQICVEIHTNRTISIDEGIFDAYRLILRLYRAGYRIVYCRNMDFTFVHKRLLN